MSEQNESLSSSHPSKQPEQNASRFGSEGKREAAISRGDLYFLHHPNTADIFSGYGLTVRPNSKEILTGLLMVDRPKPADPEWLQQVEDAFGEFQLVPMTTSGERGIACQMRIEPNSLPYLRQFPTEKSGAIAQALQPLLDELPNPRFQLRWDEDQALWTSEIIPPFELPPELKEAFERTGYGCVPAETNIGIVHVCYASDRDIEGFANQTTAYQWQLALMATAPLLRLHLTIFDQPLKPFKIESFLNVGRDDDVRALQTLVAQESLYLAFHGDDFSYRSTKLLDHSPAQREHLQRLGDRAIDYRNSLPPEQRDFDRAKAEFQRLVSL